MHQDNEIRNPHEPTKRAEITIIFDVPREEATQEWMDAVIGSIKRDIIEGLGKNSAVLGKWV